MSVSVIEIELLDAVKYDEFLKQDPSSLLYVSLPYLKLLQTFLACEVKILVSEKSGEIKGIFPIAIKRNATFGTVINSLPFYGSNGGMVVKGPDKDDIRKALLEKFTEIAEEEKCVSCTIISNPLDEEGDVWLRNNVKHNLIDERIGQITHFPDQNISADDLLKTFDDPRPRNIRKAIKEGVKILRLNDTDAIDFLYQTHYQNITAINGIPKEKRFFEMVPSCFGNEQFKIYAAEYDGKRIAALLLFYYNKTVEYFTPAVVEEFRNLQPTALIIYEAMLDAISNGYKNWNWGGTWLSQGGVYDFKKKWGTTDHRYFYYTQIADQKIYYLSKEILLKEYPYFFVIPFNALKNEEN